MHPGAIICIQEHWLYSFQQNEIKELFPSHCWAIKCIDDGNPIAPIHRPRGHAGVACLWDKQIDHDITVLPDGSDRVLAIQYNDTVIINTYMPTAGTHTKISYQDITDEVHELLEKYHPQLNMIWFGDMNADPQRATSNNDRMLKAFCEEEELVISDKIQEPTYHHFTGTSRSKIDLVIQPAIQDLIEDIKVDVRNPINLSCHDAIIAKLNIGTVAATTSAKSKYTTPAPTKIKWNKVDLPMYRNLTFRRLTKMLQYIDDRTPTDLIVKRTNAILSKSALDCHPTSKPRKQTTYKWAHQLKTYAVDAKEAHARWKEEGRPEDPLHPAYHSKTEAKRSLRRQQKQINARERDERQRLIMEACENDHRLFYQLIKRQRSDGQDAAAQINFKFDPKNQNSQTENWAEYFEKLATPQDLPQYNAEHHETTKLKLLLIEMLTPKSPSIVLDQKQVKKHISQLKNNKAADPFGISAEHLKEADPCLTPILTDITNRIFKDQSIPEDLKLGAITPVLKKQKNKQEPDNYRRITVNSMIGKIIDSEMVPHTRAALAPKSSKHQFGFKVGKSCVNAGLVLTELMMEAKDTKQPLFISYMDTSKAFDLVSHAELLSILHTQGVTGPLWHMYHNMYTDIKSVVKWQGVLSPAITESQGIRQGARTSADAFNGKSDPMLNKLSSHPDGYKIGSINTGAIMVADDLTLSSSTPHGIQSLIHVAENDAACHRYLFSDSKTRIQVINNKNPKNRDITLNDTPIKRSDEETHLGIQRTADLTQKATLEGRIKVARRTTFSLMGAGLYGLNGVNPITSKQLIDVYVLPRLTYGLECLPLSSNELQPTEVYFRELLRMIQHLPQSTANPACYLLLGVLPVEAVIHIKALTLFGAVMRDEGSLEYCIIERQLAMKGNESYSWAIYIKRLLSKYDLPTPLEALYEMPSKESWKKLVKSNVTTLWINELTETARAMTTMKYVNLDKCKFGQYHSVWAIQSTDPLMVHRAAIHAKILVQRYPLNTSHTSRSKTTQCPCCNTCEETLQHFLLECTKLETVRNTHINCIKNNMFAMDIEISQDNLMRAILDPSFLSEDPKFISVTVSAARSLCFYLHLTRLRVTGSDKLKYHSAGKIKRATNLLTYRPQAPGARREARELRNNE